MGLPGRELAGRTRRDVQRSVLKAVAAQLLHDTAQDRIVARIICIACSRNLIHLTGKNGINAVFGAVAHDVFQLFQRSLRKAAGEIHHHQELQRLGVLTGSLIVLQNVLILPTQIILIDGLGTVQQHVQTLLDALGISPHMGIHQTLIHIRKAHEAGERLTGVAGADEGKADLARHVGHEQLHGHGVHVGYHDIAQIFRVFNDGRKILIRKGRAAGQLQIRPALRAAQCVPEMLFHALPDHVILQIRGQVAAAAAEQQTLSILFCRGIALVLCLAANHRFVCLRHLFRVQLLYEPLPERLFPLHSARRCRLRMFCAALGRRLLLYALAAAVFGSVLLQLLLLVGAVLAHLSLQLRPVLCRKGIVLPVCLVTHLQKLLPDPLISGIRLLLQDKDRCRVILCLRRQIICFLTQHIQGSARRDLQIFHSLTGSHAIEDLLLKFLAHPLQTVFHVQRLIAAFLPAPFRFGHLFIGRGIKLPLFPLGAVIDLPQGTGVPAFQLLLLCVFRLAQLLQFPLQLLILCVLFRLILLQQRDQLIRKFCHDLIRLSHDSSPLFYLWAVRHPVAGLQPYFCFLAALPGSRRCASAAKQRQHDQNDHNDQNDLQRTGCKRQQPDHRAGNNVEQRQIKPLEQ